MNKARRIFRSHYMLVIYGAMIGILLIGMLYDSGVKYMPEMAIFLVSLISTYLLARYTRNKIRLGHRFSRRYDVSAGPVILFAISLVLLVGHVIALGHLPGLTALSLVTTSEVAAMRKAIVADASTFWNYTSSLNIKAIIPFTLVVLYARKNKLFWFLLIPSMIYSFGLMQKAYILIVLVPLIILTLYRKDWKTLFLNIFVSAAVVVGLMYVSNPEFRGGINDAPHVEIKAPEGGALFRISKGITKRVFLLPGETVVDWFETIPDKKPFLNGDGYRFIARMKGTEHRNYAKELYPVVYPELAEAGYQGSVNVASFMYEYSNFGRLGLALAGLLLGLLFVFIQAIFKDNVVMGVSINLFQVFMLSSQALSTALVSGGWGLLIILFFIFKPDLKK